MTKLKDPIYKAAIKLCGGAFFVMEGEDAYENIKQWFVDTPPSKDDVIAEANRLEVEHQLTQYQRDRAQKYPPITDYLDGLVKGDQAQIDKYIADCLAVKAMYPKPTVE